MMGIRRECRHYGAAEAGRQIAESIQGLDTDRERPPGRLGSGRLRGNDEDAPGADADTVMGVVAVEMSPSEDVSTS